MCHPWAGREGTSGSPECFRVWGLGFRVPFGEDLGILDNSSVGSLFSIFLLRKTFVHPGSTVLEASEFLMVAIITNLLMKIIAIIIIITTIIIIVIISSSIAAVMMVVIMTIAMMVRTTGADDNHGEALIQSTKRSIQDLEFRFTVKGVG